VHATDLRVGGVELLESGGTLLLLRRALIAAFWVLALLLTSRWLVRVFDLFPYTRPWGERLDGFLVDTLLDLLTGIAGAVPDLLVAVLIFLIARFVVGLIDRFFDQVQSGRVQVGWLAADVVRPTRRLVTTGAWLLALVMAYPYLPGASTDAFKGISVLVGLMISIGGASVLGQAVSGLTLMYTRTLHVGEYVRIGEYEGTVVYLGIYQTRIRTGFGEELTLPNSLVLGAVTRNFSRGLAGGSFTLHASATIGFDAPWRQVHAMLREAARRTDGVAADPPPEVFQTALSDFYVEYRLVVRALPGEPRLRVEVKSRLHENIQDVFNEHGVQIMSPHYLGDPAEAKVVPKARWYAPPARPPSDAGSPIVGVDRP
jgi:small-conductance mechanosensitive channel